MMSIRIIKQGFVLLVVFSLCFLLCSGFVSAAGFYQSDDPNDVCIIRSEDNTVICNQSYPSVDILKVARSYSNDTLQLIIILNGQINETSEANYKIWYNTSGNNSVYRYMMNYSQTNQVVWRINPDGNKTILDVTPQIMSNKHMITVFIPNGVVKFNENIEGVARTRDDAGTWFDTVTNAKTIDPIPFNGTTPNDLINGNNSNGSGSIPGFHFIVVIIGMMFVLGFMYRKRIQ